MEEEDPMEKSRRHYSPEQKVAILREHLVEQMPVSEVCEKHQIHPTLFYQWQKTFFENGATAFERERPRSQSLGKEQDKINRLEAKLKDRDEAPAELMQEHVRLKKELGEI
jgi:transposase-like protein